LFWGDAIGGEVAAVFADPDSGSNIADVRVHTDSTQRDAFFSHNFYWNLRFGKNAPHILALQKAIDLADTGTADCLGG
jgi:hypothetical protein